MSEEKERVLRVRAVRRPRADLRALARVLIELALDEAAADERKDTSTEQSA